MRPQPTPDEQDGIPLITAAELAEQARRSIAMHEAIEPVLLELAIQDQPTED